MTRLMRPARIIWPFPALAALLLIALCLIALPERAGAQEFPKLTGRVVDAANILSPADENALAGQLAALEVQSQRQFVIATIADLQGYPIEDYGYRLGRHWAIGDKARNDGILLIVAPTERKVRIEVGYGLEPLLTDALSTMIIQQDILPRFKAGDYPGGIKAGANRIIAQLQLPPEEAIKVAKDAQESADAPDIGNYIFWAFVILFFVLPTIRSFFGHGRRHGRGGAAPVVIWGPDSGHWGNSWGSGGSHWGGGGGGGFGGFSGGGGSFGGGGSSGSW